LHSYFERGVDWTSEEREEIFALTQAIQDRTRQDRTAAEREENKEDKREKQARRRNSRKVSSTTKT
jgi:hypothetical protein